MLCRGHASEVDIPEVIACKDVHLIHTATVKFRVVALPITPEVNVTGADIW